MAGLLERKNGLVFDEYFSEKDFEKDLKVFEFLEKILDREDYVGIEDYYFTLRNRELKEKIKAKLMQNFLAATISQKEVQARSRKRIEVLLKSGKFKEVEAAIKFLNKFKKGG